MSTTRTESAPIQARSRVSREAFLDAAESLFSISGIAQTAVTDVAAEAGRSIGSLYHQFDDKAALVAAVVDRITEHLEAEVARGIDPATWAGQPLTDIVVGYVTAGLATERMRPGYKRIIAEVCLTDQKTRVRHRRLRGRLNDGLTSLLLERREEIGHPDPDTAVRYVVDQLIAMLTARLDATTTRTALQEHTDEQFLDACIESVTAYLRLGRGSNQTSS